MFLERLIERIGIGWLRKYAYTVRAQQLEASVSWITMHVVPERHNSLYPFRVSPGENQDRKISYFSPAREQMEISLTDGGLEQFGYVIHVSFADEQQG